VESPAGNDMRMPRRVALIFFLLPPSPSRKGRGKLISRRVRFILAFVSIFFPGIACAESGDAWVQAIARRDLPALAQLLPQNKRIVNRAGPDGKTALMLAAGAARADLVRALLGAGAEVNAVNARGGTALMYAATAGDPQTAGMLLSHGAAVNARAENGWTAVTLAAATGRASVVRQLLAAGADANIADLYGWTPLMRAVDSDRAGVVRVLLRNSSVRVNARDDQGETALHHAAARGSLEMARLLLAHGADARATDAAGRTPAIVAAGEGHAGLADFLGRQP
jgi:ankyrin repeat protein